MTVAIVVGPVVIVVVASLGSLNAQEYNRLSIVVPTVSRECIFNYLWT